MDIKRLNKMSLEELDKAITVEKKKKETANETIKLLETIKTAKRALAQSVPSGAVSSGQGVSYQQAGLASGAVQGGYN